MKALLILSLLLLSTSASAYCIKYNSYGTCVQDNGAYKPNNDYQRNNTVIKPLPVIPPLGTRSCDWVIINNQWQSVCR